MKKDFELLPHTADIKLRIYGSTIAELFRNALVGMFQSIGPRAQGCCVVQDRLVCDALPQSHEITIESPDLVSLLVDFLSYALYLSDVHDEAYLDVTIHEITTTHVYATLHGVPITGFAVVEIKAVTYHDLEIQQIDGAWQADVVFDI